MFSRGYPSSPALSFRHNSVLTLITLIGSQDLAVKSRPRPRLHGLQNYLIKTSSAIEEERSNTYSTSCSPVHDLSPPLRGRLKYCYTDLMFPYSLKLVCGSRAYLRPLSSCVTSHSSSLQQHNFQPAQTPISLSTSSSTTKVKTSTLQATGTYERILFTCRINNLAHIPSPHAESTSCPDLGPGRAPPRHEAETLTRVFPRQPGQNVMPSLHRQPTSFHYMSRCCQALESFLRQLIAVSTNTNMGYLNSRLEAEYAVHCRQELGDLFKQLAWLEPFQRSAQLNRNIEEEEIKMKQAKAEQELQKERKTVEQKRWTDMGMVEALDRYGDGGGCRVTFPALKMVIRSAIGLHTSYAGQVEWDCAAELRRQAVTPAPVLDGTPQLLDQGNTPVESPVRPRPNQSRIDETYPDHNAQEAGVSANKHPLPHADCLNQTTPLLVWRTKSSTNWPSLIGHGIKLKTVEYRKPGIVPPPIMNVRSYLAALGSDGSLAGITENSTRTEHLFLLRLVTRHWPFSTLQGSHIHCQGTDSRLFQKQEYEKREASLHVACRRHIENAFHTTSVNLRDLFWAASIVVHELGRMKLRLWSNAEIKCHEERKFPRKSTQQKHLGSRFSHSKLPAVRNFQTTAVTRDIDSAAKFIGAGAATVGVAGSEPSDDVVDSEWPASETVACGAHIQSTCYSTCLGKV
ncbi:hypothetical protein PR048_008894 [Dryococelus australis]|uniref:Uncharacterized protein n=1 Tax=Dryococelus australis TaxID=614101 RepID=A0ABQ9HYD8_9NEOP|nr:hypothetical protein PR048_008894 [Dryococelus australis]